MKSTMDTRNFVYGCRRPANADELIEIMSKANRYRNRLVEIELEKRKRSRDAAMAASPEWAAAVAECERLTGLVDSAIASRKQKEHEARGRLDHNDNLADCRKMLSKAWQAEKPLRKAAYQAAATQLEAIKEDAYSVIRESRDKCGLYWGTYLLVEQAAEEFARGAPPKFTRFTGEGRVGVQLQNGMSVERLLSGDDRRLRLAMRDDRPVSKQGRVLPQSTHRDRFRTLSLRIGSSDRGAPIFAEVPVIWHRDLPDGAVIKWAILQRHLVAGKERWSLIVTVDVPKASTTTNERLANEWLVGVDINYRIMPSGRQRIAHACGDDGQRDELYLPAGTVSEYAKVADIQSIRDKAFDQAKADLLAWVDGREPPRWFSDQLQSLDKWRSCRRLANFVLDWQTAYPVLDGQEDILDRLDKWRQRENHLFHYQENLRDQVLARRKDLYRCWVSKLAARYSAVVLEKMDLRQAIHDTLRPEELQEVESPQRRAAAFACLSSLRQFLSEKMSVITVPPEGTTLLHNACGLPSGIDAKRDVCHVCNNCGVEFDQDENAAANILARGVVAHRESLANESGKGVTVADGRRKKVSRSERNAAARNKRSEAARAKRLR